MQSVSRNGGGGGSGAGWVNVREFLQTAVQLLQQLGRGELAADQQKFRFLPDDLRQARVPPFPFSAFLWLSYISLLLVYLIQYSFDISSGFYKLKPVNSH